MKQRRKARWRWGNPRGNGPTNGTLASFAMAWEVSSLTAQPLRPPARMEVDDRRSTQQSSHGLSKARATLPCKASLPAVSHFGMLLARPTSSSLLRGYDADLYNKVLRADEGDVRRVWNSVGIQGRGKRVVPEKTRRTVASSGNDSHTRKPGSDPAANRTRFAWVGGEQSNHVTTVAGCTYCYLVRGKSGYSHCNAQSALFVTGRDSVHGHKLVAGDLCRAAGRPPRLMNDPPQTPPPPRRVVPGDEKRVRWTHLAFVCVFFPACALGLLFVSPPRRGDPPRRRLPLPKNVHDLRNGTFPPRPSVAAQKSKLHFDLLEVNDLGRWLATPGFSQVGIVPDYAADVAVKPVLTCQILTAVRHDKCAQTTCAADFSFTRGQRKTSDACLSPQLLCPVRKLRVDPRQVEAMLQLPNPWLDASGHHPVRSAIASAVRDDWACCGGDQRAQQLVKTLLLSASRWLSEASFTLPRKVVSYSTPTETVPRRISFRPPPIPPPPPEQTSRDRDSHESARATRRCWARTQLTSLSAGPPWHPKVEWPRPRTRRHAAPSLSLLFYFVVIFFSLAHRSAVGLIASHQDESGSIPGRLTPDFRKWESRRTMPLAGGFSRGLPSPPLVNSSAAPYPPHFTLIGSQDLDRLACSPPIDANRARSPAGLLPDFLTWESCRTMPLVGAFSRGSPVSHRPSFRWCSMLTSLTLVGSQDLAALAVRRVQPWAGGRSTWTLGRERGRAASELYGCSLHDFKNVQPFSAERPRGYGALD
ncbi:hypothetical protein PR048_004264 [Dryococelus australis]|uniref:Uncharacterized protein n=1 Tax=Dryococelus australis TaxID=614101 RepID=A0ABQ9I650_9NEOP|nr:hypothetical protein PR048_004264 [Dryococelus australis]